MLQKSNHLKPLVINFAPTGMVPTREMHPEVPLQPQEVIEQVQMAVGLGITLVHLHARDAEGRPGLNPEIYAKIILGIRTFARDLPVCVSLSGRNAASLEERLAPLDLEGDAKPDMASLTPGSLNFSRQASVNEPDHILAIAAKMREKSILPELEIFDLGMLGTVRYLIAHELLTPPYYFNLMLGNAQGLDCEPGVLGLLVRDLPQPALWSVGGIGRSQFNANLLSIASGGGVRTGLEDNFFMDHERTQHATNIGLLKRIHAVSAMGERPVMSSAEFRAAMHLETAHGQYGKRTESI